ncbi:MAG: glycosyltransferase family 4 protein [Candidatus Mcinerneyibacterium aminivorans]|uniref:Glycosyltransferase family 4 protein n=1 Tax=Candidatus Mcinerneyibacterium aminivorans TaxID=2703815 RepID=A0A5D0MGG0_9BACT|nr:MAG: glycosyltransferase family 4 protein [Candidatus Mcinerneyibacterium aminivorans]
MKEIYFFHYHFLTGGVNTVVKKLIEILKNRYKITIFTSLEMGIEGIQNQLKYENVEVNDFPEIRYIYPENIDKDKFNKLKNKILARLKKNHKENALYWVHNYHLGKNPAFTSAFINFIKKEGVKTILQIHDFPECARWVNYKFLDKYVDHTLYPLSNNIVYSTINKRDFERLRDAGVPEKNLFYLPNSVSLDRENINKKQKKNIRREIFDKLKELIKIKENEYLFLYPTRTIRRKNILEAILVNRLFNKRSNLIVTLGANSKKERKYEETVKKVFNNEKIKGVWAISKHFPDLFPKLMKGSDLLITTSLLEGFGLMYLESKINKQNFFSRKINILEDFENIEEESYYTGIKVYNKKKDFLVDRYESKIDSLKLKKKYKKILLQKVREKINKRIIDYSYLDVDSQKDICLKKNINEIKKLNKGVSSKMLKLTENYKKQGINLDFFSFEKYRKRVKKLVKEVEKENNLNYDNNQKKKIDEKVMKSFLKIKYIRLIFDY